MPSAALHSNYWANANPSVETVTPVDGTYPLWQASVITPSLFGSLQIVCEWLIRKAGR